MVAVFPGVQEQGQVRGPAGQGGDAGLDAVEGGFDVFLELVRPVDDRGGLPVESACLRNDLECAPDPDGKGDADFLAVESFLADGIFRGFGEVGSTCLYPDCLLYTSDAADDLLCVDLGGRRFIKKKQKNKNNMKKLLDNK